MAQKRLVQEPLSPALGGTGKTVFGGNGLLVGAGPNPLLELPGTTPGEVLRSNGVNWEKRVGGKLIQAVWSSYSTQVATSTNTYIPTGLTCTLNQKLRGNLGENLVLIIVRQCGLGKQFPGANRTTYGGLILYDSFGNSYQQFGYPFGYMGNSPYAFGVGSASLSCLYTPTFGGTLSFNTKFTNMSGDGNVIVQWNGAMSTMIMMEFAKV